MSRAKLLPSAKADLLELFTYIATRSHSVSAAQKFDRRIRDYCHHLATLPFPMGRIRPDISPEIRSVTFEAYVILFRYTSGRLEVVNILEGHLDIPQFFTPTNPR